MITNTGSCLLPTQGHHDKLNNRMITNTGSCLLPTQWYHDKLNNQMITNSCMPRAPMYLRDYPKVTLLGGPLSRTHLHRGNCVSKLHDGSCCLSVDVGENEVIYDQVARRYAQHGLKDPRGDFDSADEEVRTIMSRGQEADKARDVGTIKLNVFEQPSDSESIEVLSGREGSEDEEFLGYYTVGPDGKRRPIPAPRRLVRMPAATGIEAGAASAVIQSSSSAIENAEPKTGKEVVFAEVRRHHISLSDDSQGRDLSLIPPGSDGHSTLNTHSMLNRGNMSNTLPQLSTLPQQESGVLNTLPQCQSTEEAWYQTGPEFRQGQTRFRSYGNTFEAGVVLPE